ncbi:uncharacterized protein BDR25DRAFT_351421 [Lindgomyces ingoldianus]|uniref:Uncharacterized protein n=1 Tax=Lindgomyces ingoldianus TaxID=673940 RepID=A0ACB6R866_9PLEO|nr:uncharacterized protein BDR25DRAFT_351421 [Lindgomyces ingoldianus]KAF2474940.1 hypothetical protein BDR25DRAFT_351421 [Lindgomyces ingoldianus]
MPIDPLGYALLIPANRDFLKTLGRIRVAPHNSEHYNLPFEVLLSFCRNNLPPPRTTCVYKTRNILLSKPWLFSSVNNLGRSFHMQSLPVELIKPRPNPRTRPHHPSIHEILTEGLQVEIFDYLLHTDHLSLSLMCRIFRIVKPRHLPVVNFNGHAQ